MKLVDSATYKRDFQVKPFLLSRPLTRSQDNIAHLKTLNRRYEGPRSLLNQKSNNPKQKTFSDMTEDEKVALASKQPIQVAQAFQPM